jgi:S-(hydroxymethyl)glutathione dehydrogenase / alcohol dehydrogenase
MKALVFHKPKDVRVEQVKDPKIEHAQDIILRVTSTAICGSDLHIYNGLFPQLHPMVLGHEFMGVVEEIGSEVKALKRGDRVVVPFPIACGDCFFCKRELTPHCETSNPKHYGPEGGTFTQKGGALFGYTDLYGGYSGGQAEYVRVPFANFGPRKIPEGMTDEQVLFLTDILPTGWAALDWAEPKGNESIAVFGCGPVGLMAQKLAWLKNPKQVIGIDIQPDRLEMARKIGASVVINANEGDEVEQIRSLTDGRGADICIDAVGMEADRSLVEKAIAIAHLERGSMSVLHKAVSAVRRGGVISVVGVYGTPFHGFPLGQIFDKGISLRAGQAHAHKYIDKLLALIQDRKIRADDIITHRLPLDEAPHAYKIFNRKEDGCVKVVLTP